MATPLVDIRCLVRATLDVSVSLDGVIGIVLYGSVARGEADRRSDSDLWVLTTKDRGPNQREANAVGRDLEDAEFDGNRYAYDIDVETVHAIPTYTEDVRGIVVSGIPIYSTNKFETVENFLLEEGDSDDSTH
ncbi:nucleotidyltransferase [Halorubrum tropicale]|uniref:Nucleotidyltransferase n=1 Tax=Halorubrum tropicale TaxID=1765655 RepID=A0A0N1IUY2_9EURY|nr:nucleotidyltransferase [Halorubrum tropicale]